ncbi:MAG: hypothetical protein ACREK5_04560 [Gemmatimonadota bacterium]
MVPLGAWMTPGTTTAPCSIEHFPASRSPEAITFIAVALPDSVEAGPGDKRVFPHRYDDPGIRLDEPLAKLPRPVFGQVFQIEEIETPRATGPREALVTSGNRVVIVPWEYRGDCRTTLWRESARWVEPGARGFFVVGDPRPPDQWAAGLPTFDVSGWQNPYPHAEFMKIDFRYRSGGKPVLDVDEFRSLYDALPTWEEVAADPERAYARLESWRETHPEAAERFPATRIWAEASGQIERSRPTGQRSSGRAP